jgi:hypothetical protein
MTPAVLDTECDLTPIMIKQDSLEVESPFERHTMAWNNAKASFAKTEAVQKEADEDEEPTITYYDENEDYADS